MSREQGVQQEERGKWGWSVRVKRWGYFRTGWHHAGPFYGLALPFVLLTVVVDRCDD